MRLGMVDGKGWPVVMPVWHVFERGVFRIATGTTSHKANVLRANERAYFTVDTGGNYGDTRGVRGPATYGSSTVTSVWRSTWLARDY
jgi:nitroimidazol reductase NimA-like FMN-containing flavoprotein (pyridoxamine 5'-phosphate oxidase superfamily)